MIRKAKKDLKECMTSNIKGKNKVIKAEKGGKEGLEDCSVIE